jgi:alpha/beta superfamily hydrolase
LGANQSFDLPGPAGRLEALLMRPVAAPVAAAVVCHAHPLHGGMMHFKVVFRAAKALQEQGLVVLRFNFRGVGRSEGQHDHGEGEQADASAALGEMERRFPGLPLVLGGFSFGAAMALRVGAAEPRVRALFALGFPFRMVGDTTFLNAVRTPRLFVQGENDAFGGEGPIRQLVAPLPEPKRLVVVPGSDHFFDGHLDTLHATLAQWASERPWSLDRKPVDAVAAG